MSYDLLPQDLLRFAAHGLIDLPWWGYVVVALALTHVTIAVGHHLPASQPGASRRSTCIRRSSHFFRFWLWLTTGMVTKEWVAIHRKHHAKVETPDDPHSPQTRGIDNGLLGRRRALSRRVEERRRRWTSTATARRTTGSSATSTRASRGRASA